MKIYIGNLPKDFEKDELLEMFTEYGNVKSAKIILDRYTKVSRGFGFVEMANNDEALQAIKDWNHGSIDDRVIQVRESKFKTKNRKRR